MKLLDPSRPKDLLGNLCYVGTDIVMPSIGIFTDHGGGIRVGVKVPIAKNHFDYRYRDIGENIVQLFSEYLEDPEAALVKWFEMPVNWHEIERKIEIPRPSTNPPRFAPNFQIKKVNINDLDF